ncbi:MAG: PASTA domain-containing protein [Acidobacteriales bacterium]|nr:PASTA domain-containing protein [Terriglobales bacterium]
MPSFLGQRLGSVRQAIQDAGMKTGIVGSLTVAGRPELPAATSDTDLVAWQDPPSGQRVVTGATVSLKVR